MTLPEDTDLMRTPEILTVIIRDSSPYVIEEPFTYRTVHVHLTPEQRMMLRFRHQNEGVSTCFFEPNGSEEAGHAD
jgi:hypothetical protein